MAYLTFFFWLTIAVSKSNIAFLYIKKKKNKFKSLIYYFSCLNISNCVVDELGFLFPHNMNFRRSYLAKTFNFRSNSACEQDKSVVIFVAALLDIDGSSAGRPEFDQMLAI